MDSNATQALEQNLSSPPSVDLKKFYQESGVIPNDEAKTVQLPEAATIGQAPAAEVPAVPGGGSGSDSSGNGAGAGDAAGGSGLDTGMPLDQANAQNTRNVATGVGKGAADLVKNIYNSGIDTANGISKLAASMGIGRGDVIGDENKIQWSAIAQKPGDPTVEQVFRGLTRYGAPVAAVVASGGSALGALAAGAGVDYATLDPHQERLASLINDKYPQLKNVAVVGNLVDYLRNKGDESDLEGRFKNAVEGLLAGGVMTGATEGAIAAFRGAQKVSSNAAKYLAEKSPELAKVGEAATSAETGAMKIEKPILSEEELAAQEASYKTNSLFSDAHDIPVEGGTVVNPNHGDMVKAMGRFVEQNREELNSVKYVPRTGESIHADAQAILKDPERTKAMFRDTTAAPHTGSEIEAMRAIHDNMTAGVMALADKAAATKAPEDLAAYTNAKANWNAIQNIKTASGSTTGADLNMQSVMKDFLGGKTIGMMEEQTALEQKKVLIDGINKFSGGEPNIAEEAEKISAINRLNPAQTQKALDLMNQAQKGGWQKAKDTANFLMINSMLSSMKTFTKVAVSQTTTTLGSAMDRITAAALPTWLGGSDLYTMRDAGNFVKGNVDAILENMASVSRSMGMGEKLPDGVRKYNVDFTKSNPITAQNYGINPESLYATIVDKFGQFAGGPSKLVGMHDSIFGQIPFRGTVNQMVESRLDKMGLQGAERELQKSKMMAQDMPVDIFNAATKAAQEATMMGDYADNTLGQIGKGLSKFAGEDIPGGNVFFPFMKIGFNIADYTYQHSPFKGLAAALSPEIRASMGVAGSAERAMAVAKIANGSMMLGATTLLASQGLITGHEPENYNVAKALKESNVGWMPDSLHTPNGYVSLKGIEPLTSYMRLGALMAHAHNYTTADEYQQLAVVAGGLVAESFSPEMLVQNNGSLFDAIRGIYKPEDHGHPVAGLAAGIASRLVPNIVNDVRNVVDINRADTNPGAGFENFISGVEKIKNVLENRVPWMSEKLPIDRNKFGEPILVPAAMPKADVTDWKDRAMSMVSPFAQSSGEKSPLVQGMQILSKYYEENQPMNSDLKALNVQMPSRTFRMNGVSVPLTPQEYEKYVMYSAGKDPKTGEALVPGGDLRSRLEAQIPALVEGMKNSKLDERTYNLVVGKLSGELVRFQKQGDGLMLADPEFNQRYQDALKHTMNTPVNVFGGH